MSLDRMNARHGLPHPLARLYARGEQHHDPWRRLEDTLAFTEGAARFFAWVLTAEQAARGAGDRALRSAMKSSDFGAFLKVLVECRAARAGVHDRFLPEFEAFYDGPGVALWDECRRLRNDAAHHRTLRDPAWAARTLDALSPRLRAFLDGMAFLTAYPFGAVLGARPEHDGALVGHWSSCRGLDHRGAPVPVRDVSGLPDDVVVLLDLDANRALTLSPFFLCGEAGFAWLDRAPEVESHLRGDYARPVADAPVPEVFPRRLHDARGASRDGLTLEAWLSDPAQRPRVVALRLDVASSRAVRDVSLPTMHGARAVVPAGHALASPVAPVSIAPTRVHLDAPPAYAATQTMPEPVAPTVLSLPPAAAFTPTPPPPAPLVVMAHAPPPTRGPRAAGPSAWVYLALFVVGCAIAGLSAAAIHEGLARRHAQGEPGAAPSDDPSAPRDTSRSAQPLDTAPELLRWVEGWRASLTPGSNLAASVDRLYGDPISFHGMDRPTHARVVGSWTDRLRAGRFDVDLSRSTWSTEAPAARRACLRQQGATGRTQVILLHATERGIPARVENRDACPVVEGPYILRLRRVGAAWRVCHESWHIDDALCRSCPGLRFCSGR